MSRERVIIVIILDSLNGLDFQCADVQNTYPNATPKEHVYFYAGEEFGKDWGKKVVLVRELYVLKGAGSKWKAAISKLRRDLGLQP